MPRLKSPKQKGDNYERELADYFNENLIPGAHRRFEFRRAPLSGGGVSDSVFDLTGTQVRTHEAAPYWYELGVEAKRVEKINIWEAMAQAKRHLASMAERGYDVGRTLPIVVTRRNHTPTGESLCVIPLWALVKLIRGD